MRLMRRSVPLALLLLVFAQGNALAATVNVSMTNFVFTPKTATLTIGGTVHWMNDTPTTNHTSTGDTPLSLWDSGTVLPGGSFNFVFTAGGKYTYHCTFHQGLGMVGTVSVKIKASPPSGPVGTTFTITVGSINAPAGFVYDIQKRNPGGNFQNWMLGVTTKSVPFDSTGMPSGTYSFRSLLHKTSDNSKSGFSAAKSIMVT